MAPSSRRIRSDRTWVMVFFILLCARYRYRYRCCYRYRYRCCLSFIDFPAIHHKALPKELGDEVEEHVDGRNQIGIPRYGFGREHMLEPSGGWGEEGIIERHERHGSGHVGIRAESEAAVEGEIPKHRQHQCK